MAKLIRWHSILWTGTQAASAPSFPHIKLDNRKQRTATQLALTLIHELGHAANQFRAGSSTIEDDGGEDEYLREISRANSRNVRDACLRAVENQVKQRKQKR
jgi:hypothetical protein